MKKQIFFIFSIMVFVAASARAASEASWIRSNTASSMNPRISLIGDFLARSGTANQTEDGFSVREVELGIQAEVDPYARADVFIGGMNDQGGSASLEEAYVTLLALPWGLQARGGKFRLNVGKLNIVHPHEYPQVDQPLVLEEFYGEEGLNSTGFEISKIFAPFGIYTEASYAMVQDLGESETASHTISVTNENTENDVEVSLPGEESDPSQRIGNFAHTAKIRTYADISDTVNVDLGFSGVIHQPSATETEQFDRRRFGAVDVTFRWKPLAQGTYQSFVWRTEGHYTDQDLVEVVNPYDPAEVEAPAARIHRRGAYSYVEYQPWKRWRAGVRGDYAEDPAVRDDDTPHITRALAPYVTFTLTEFNRFRVQYERRSVPGGETEDLGFLQWTFVLGPHGAHPF